MLLHGKNNGHTIQRDCVTVFISLADLLQLKGQLGAAHDGVVVVVKVFVVVAGQRAGFLRRDDAGKFLGAYYDKKIYENDPFAKLDQVGVGKLVEMAAKLGRATRPDLHLGICGEHGGDPSSVEFCHRVGLDYVSCSPFRVPIARLAAAQAAIREQRQ